jgi:CheY-specific phosphatase CheX
MVAAFSSAVPFALREMAGIEAVVLDSRPATGTDGFPGLSAAIRLTAVAGEGRLTLSIPEATAKELARRILTETTDQVSDDLIRDCAGEVANVVAGQAKALLVGRPCHFTLSTPMVRAGGLAEASGGWLIQFDSDAGPFAVHLRPPS